MEYDWVEDKSSKTDSARNSENAVVFNIKIDDNQYADDVKCDRKNEDVTKQEYLDMKSRAYAAQMPLHSISEDINSPYFASSNSNIWSFSNTQKTPKSSQSPLVKENKLISGSGESQEIDQREKKLNEGHTQTTITISEITDSVTIDRLEKIRTKLHNKRSKLISVFETYLNKWDVHKIDEDSDINLSKLKPVNLNKYKTNQNSPKKKLNRKKTVKSQTQSIDFSALKPILSARNKNTRRYK